MVFEGSTILETYVDGKSAWWVAPLASDPVNLAPDALQKQQWMWGSLFGGVAGAVIFVNKLPRPGNTGLEIGARTDLGASNPMSRYSFNDVAIQGFGAAVKWNAIRNYICSFHRFHLENNDTQVVYGDGVNVKDAGEKVIWYDSVFASGGTGFPAHHIRADTVSLQFFGCSFDYLTTIFKVDANAGYQSIDIYGGRIESINASTRYVPGRHGIVVSDIATPYLRVGLHAVPFVISNRETQFHGKMRLTLDMDYRSTAATVGTIANLCDSDVQVVSLNFDRHAQGTRVSENLNMVRDASLMTDPVGPIVSSLMHWGMGESNASAELVAYGSKRAVKITTTGNGDITIFPKARSAIRTGERVRLMLSGYKPVAGVNFTGHIRFYDSAGVEISRTVEEAFVMPTGVVGAWTDPVGDIAATAPAGAVQFAPYYTGSSQTAQTGILMASPYAVVD